MSHFEETLERLSRLSPKRLALLAAEQQDRLNAVERAAREPVAIVGVGCRFPGKVDDPESFWRLLVEGRDAIIDVPPERWDVDAYYSPELMTRLSMSTRWGGFIERVDEFDPEFFSMSHSEACTTDPQQRLLLEVTWEALERAGLSATQLAGTETGVFVGASGADYFLMMKYPPPRGCLGVAMSILANRISHFFDFRGPSMMVDTACSSAAVAVDLACQALRSGTCQLAVAGGVNLISSPVATISASHAGMMSPDGRCKVFDERANGYVRSEGCGVVILKRLSDALASRDPIEAVILGSAVNQDGRTGIITAPNHAAQRAVIQQALRNAGRTPEDVTYIETHGTGTNLGDPIEVESLGHAFPARPDGKPCALGAVKANIGHTEAAAGMAGLIKLVLSLKHRVIPPVAHFRKLNPHISLEGTPFIIPTSAQPWSSDGTARVGGVSSFAFGGTNTHIVVEEAPPPEPSPSGGTLWTRHLLPLSARREQALREMARRYAKHLADHPGLSFSDVCYTAATGRVHFRHRLVVNASTCEEAREQLLAYAERGQAPGVLGAASGQRPKVAFLFAGSDSLYAGMGRALYESESVFRAALDRCGELLSSQLDRPLQSMLSTEGAAAWKDEPAFAQPAVFALEHALSELWRSWGVVPDAVMGHGAGEYVAACLAGVISLEEGLALVAASGRLMQERTPPGAMAEALRRRAGEVAFRSPRIPMLSRRNGSFMAADFAPGADYFGAEPCSPEQLATGVGMLSSQGYGVLLELGPKDALLQQARQSLPDRTWQATTALASLAEGDEGGRTLSEAVARLYVAGYPITWQGLSPAPRGRRVLLPTYPFQRQRCWLSPDEIRQLPQDEDKGA
ncbi:type I polyketide synthase [Sorangium sp. So ce1097]|uniref:type I polyketide synthase n=1 Tax=Sorangium sp. So ce1097 TaxID=3133330 RepID=UPI003F6062C6